MTNRSPSREDAFRAVYDAHFRDVLGYAVRRVPDPHDAADVVSETFLVVWRRLEDLPDPAETRAWLFGVARRVLANLRRGAERRARLAERLGASLASTSLRSADTVTGDQQLVGDALERVSPDDRELLTLTSWEGLTTAELAVVFEITPEAVRARLHRARARLRIVLEGCAHREKEGA